MKKTSKIKIAVFCFVSVALILACSFSTFAYSSSDTNFLDAYKVYNGYYDPAFCKFSSFGFSSSIRDIPYTFDALGHVSSASTWKTSVAIYSDYVGSSGSEVLTPAVFSYSGRDTYACFIPCPLFYVDVPITGGSWDILRMYFNYIVLYSSSGGSSDTVPDAIAYAYLNERTFIRSNGSIIEVSGFLEEIIFSYDINGWDLFQLHPYAYVIAYTKRSGFSYTLSDLNSIVFTSSRHYSIFSGWNSGNVNLTQLQHAFCEYFRSNNGYWSFYSHEPGLPGAGPGYVPPTPDSEVLSSFSSIGDLFESILVSFFTIPIFGYFSLGMILSIPVALSICIFVLKLFGGG